ncbi:MAG: right-handed parallel beta-helix repeat-containing protein [Gammaproteobacteria bacterium]|nr:right-handed parallel beta-helix repeat-containing protein [Gammaproteobacteria bacterium]MDH5653489.1 right-handed parallel beta-helix repeat-containing protein [Gammaproteobacteria bacterium]
MNREKYNQLFLCKYAPAVLIPLLSFTGCGGGDTGDGRGINLDVTPPAIISNLSQNAFTLTWTAPGDDGTSGTANRYDIRYSTTIITAGNWAGAIPVNNTPSPQVPGSLEQITVPGLSPNTTYYFAIKTADEAGNVSALSNLAIAPATNVNTYYVSPAGTASWAECANINTPCSGKTAVQNAMAGDTVYFRGGTYDPAADPVQAWLDTADNLKYETLPWNPSNSGSPGNPITFKAYPGETPVFLDNSFGGSFGAVNRNWIVWDGITATIVDYPDFPIQLVVFNYAGHCVLRNSNLIGIRKATHHNSALVFLTYSHDILIENNRIHGMNSYEPTDPEYIETANNASGILNFYSYNMFVKNNDIFDNYYGIWDKDTEQNNQYLNNHIWGTNAASAGCNTGIQVNDQLSEYGASSGARAYNNIIRNCDIAISVYDGVGTSNGVAIYNNTITDSDSTNQAGIFITGSSNGADVYNNIIFGYQNQVRYYQPYTTTVASSNYNIFYSTTALQWHIDWTTSFDSLAAWNTATTFDANSRTVDPLFLNSGGASPDDYKLQSESPAVSTGKNGTTIGAFPADGNLIIGYRP